MPDQDVKWRLPEQWTIIRADGGRVTFDLNQDGDTIAGTARADAADPDVTGIMSGSTTGDRIEMTIYWPDAKIAEYEGSVAPDGKVRGTLAGEGVAGPTEWTATELLSSWT